jgi:hypothetical protein
LPFVALVALAAGAVVVERRASEPEVTSAIVENPARRLPVAAEPDALSTAWYCSGGTAQGDQGLAELSVVVANADDQNATAEVTAMGTDDEASTTVDVPANDQVRVEADDLLSADWVGMSVEVLDGEATVEREVIGPQGFAVSPCASQASPEWFVPSGSTLLGAEEHLVLFNPFPDSTSVDIVFATDDGPRTPAALQAFSVPGRSVRVVPFEELPARRPEVATTVTARSGRLVVDRVQVHDGTGEPLGVGGVDGGDGGDGADAFVPGAPQGLASTPAAAAAPRWLFPDAMTAPGTRTQVAIHNPGNDDAEVDVVITYEEPARVGEIEPIPLTIRPREVRVVDLTDQVGIEEGVGLTIDVRSLEQVPVVAEQLVYAKTPLAPSIDVPEGEPGASEPDLGEEPPDAEPDPDAELGPGAEPADPLEGAPAAPVPGFTVSPGSPVAATDWFLASRGATDGRNASVVVANPGAEPLSVQVEEVASGRRRALEGAAVEVPGGDRRVLDLGEASPGGALLVTADRPVVVAQAATAGEGQGISQMLASPLPHTVVDLPPTGPG